MAKRSSDILFQLIHSLEKGEKRHFKLFVKRSSSNEDLKIIQLFDAIEKLEEYNETKILKKVPAIQKPQLSNLKAHLHKQILASLRLLKSTHSLDLQLNEQFDYAHILYKKGLFNQSLKLIERAKLTALENQKYTFLLQLLALEKRIESLHITRSMQDRAQILVQESIDVSSHIQTVTRLSNLALLLYSWYIRHGHARKEEDEARIREYMNANLPHDAFKERGFYERLYLYQCFTWLAFIRQDFLMYYRYTKKWVQLFEEFPEMKRTETGHLIKGLHNLLNAHFDLRDHRNFRITLKNFESFSQTERVKENENFRVQSFVYLSQARLNESFLTGNFKEGLVLIPSIQKGLKEYALFIDPHRDIVLNYKIASLHFGLGDYNACLEYLLPIVNDNVGLRYDIQSYARLQHLLAHYELGNYELVEYLSKSVHRFMAKMENLTLLEEEILKFLKRSFNVNAGQEREELKKFLSRIKQFEEARFQARVFVYLDIVSWVESKVYRKPFCQVLQEKYLLRRRSLPTA